jgi:phage terminase large subunit
MLDSKHEDNPACTPEDIAVLDALTGVRYLRLRKGIWAAAEGMVYEEWTPERHVLSKEQLVKLGIFQENGMISRDVVKRVFAAVDWGYTNPGVIQTWAIDGDGRMYLVHEIYQTNRDIDWWIEQAKRVKDRFGVEQFVCDPAEPSYIEQFNKNRLHAIKGANDIAPGISQIQSRLKQAGDGRPRIFVYDQAIEVRDLSRVEAYQPIGFVGEILEYVWPQSRDGAPVREVPVKVNDHAMDAARYLCMWMTGTFMTSKMILEEMKQRTDVRKKIQEQIAEMYW